MKKAITILSIIVLLCGGAVAGAYAYYNQGVEKYTGIFLPNTRINGKDVSGMTPETVEKLLLSDFEFEEVTIKERGGVTETISLENVLDSLTLKTPVESYLNEEDVKRWPFAIREKRAYNDEILVSYDDEKLQAEVDKLNAISGADVEAPKDAYFHKGESDFEVVPETAGNLLDKEKAFALIKGAIEDGSLQADLEAGGCYVEAAIKSDDPSFAAVFEKLQPYKDLVVTIDFTGASETIDYALFWPWMDYDGENFHIDYEQLAQYVASLGDKYNTYQTQRNFVTHAGKTIQVGGNGGETYGFWMDVDRTVERVVAAVDSLQSQGVAAAWVTNAMTRDQENGDIGGTYIEISIKEQKMWLYKGYEQVMETDVVTGKNSDEKTRTPKGVYCLLNKKTEYTMRGTYGSQFCHFFMVFDWTGCAIHDAWWRNEFGGTIYENNGSHGCVNTPPDVMQQLFDAVYLGLPVIIY